jgi:hypothetical protein
MPPSPSGTPRTLVREQLSRETPLSQEQCELSISSLVGQQAAQRLREEGAQLMMRGVLHKMGDVRLQPRTFFLFDKGETAASLLPRPLRGSLSPSLLWAHATGSGPRHEVG